VVSRSQRAKRRRHIWTRTLRRENWKIPGKIGQTGRGKYNFSGTKKFHREADDVKKKGKSVKRKISMSQKKKRKG